MNRSVLPGLEHARQACEDRLSGSHPEKLSEDERRSLLAYHKLADTFHMTFTDR